MPKSGPLFLARAVYRRRRLRDAARLLPVVGLVLILLPALGRGTGAGAADAVYLFAVWAGLIVAAAVMAPGLIRSEGEAEPEGLSDTSAEPAPQRGPAAPGDHR